MIVLGIISEQPTLEPLIHHRRVDGKMQSRRAALFDGSRIQFPVYCARIIDNTQSRAAREPPKVARFLRRRRAMQKLRRPAFDNAVGIADAKLEDFELLTANYEHLDAGEEHSSVESRANLEATAIELLKTLLCLGD